MEGDTNLSKPQAATLFLCLLSVSHYLDTEVGNSVNLYGFNPVPS